MKDKQSRHYHHHTQYTVTSNTATKLSFFICDAKKILL